MIKKISFMLACLITVCWLWGIFSISESPNGHPYNPCYDQCEGYDQSDLLANYVEMDIIHGNITKYYVHHLVDQTPISIHLIRNWIWATDVNYEVWVDGQKIVENGYLDHTSTDPIIVTTPNSLCLGVHNIRVYSHYYEENPLEPGNPRLEILDSTKEFMLIPQNYYYQNDYATIIPVTNGISSHGAIRPALFVEGFSAPGIISGGANNTVSIISKWKNSLSDSKIYMLELKYPTQDARDNAMIVLSALRFIHNIQPTTQLLEGTSVFGYSMGGILARYALAYAEQWDIKHFCTQYISIDSPHRGGCINLNMQKTLYDLDHWLMEHATIIEAGGWDAEMLDPYLEALNSDAAKQFLRINRYAEGVTDNEELYATGTTDFLKLFSEINEEERESYLPANTILNNDPSTTNNKPGFPHKQNKIRSLAYSNGGIKKSGNTNNDAIGISYHIGYRLVLFGETVGSTHEYREALKCAYDCQPGSVTDKFFTMETVRWPDIGFHGDHELVQNYAPVIAPTRSSLYLKVENVNDNSLPDLPLFAVNNFNDLDTDIAPSDLSDILNSHSYFDKLAYPDPIVFPNNDPVWNWRHGELDKTWVAGQISSSANWLNLIENRTVCTISGHVNDTDQSQITGTMYLNGQEYQDFTINTEGNYTIPYLYTRDAEIMLVFEKPDCWSSYRDLSLNYGNAMLHDITISNVTMYDHDLNNIIVSKNGSGSFTSINQALNAIVDYCNSGLYNSEPIRIKVLPGTYPERLDLSPLAGYNIPSLTIKGWGSGVIIDAELVGSCIRMVGNSTGEIFIDNLTLTNALGGIQINLTAGNRLTVTNCTISNCVASDCCGLGIYSNIPSTISNCTITNNHGNEDGQEETSGAGLFLENNTTSPTIVTGCTISNNHAGNASALHLYGSGHFEIRNNSFWFNNPNENYQNPDPEKYVIKLHNVGSAELTQNLILEEWSPNCIQVLSSGNSTKWITISNNTFKLVGTSISVFDASRVKVRNNIFDNSSTGIKSNGQNNIFQINNNLFNTETPFEGIEYSPLVQTGCLFNQDANLDNNFVPIWDSTTMSPCIDAGLGDVDPDGTPPDIGAKKTISHKYWEYSFTTQADLEKWYWVSYPVLNSRTNNMLKASEFFEELLALHENSIGDPEPTNLDKINWMEGGEDYIQSVSWDVIDWSDNQSTHYVSSPQGYKVKLLPRSNPNYPATVTLRESGFRTASNLQFPIWGGSENWLGYFKEASAWPHEAFASIWDDINMIKTKDWCLIRARTDGDYWGLSGKVYPLHSGDMVVVTTNDDHTFQWNNPDATPPERKLSPEHFIFNEKQDYVPVYVTLTDSLLIDLKEIGLYLDGVCKGAVVIESNIEQICAYLDVDEKLSDGIVEFVFYYDGNKSQHQERKTIRMENSRFCAQYIKGNTRYPYYEISISQKDLDSVVPPVFALNQNYPNPFNPTTTISYQLPASGIVELEVYNLKGQLVKTLVKTNQRAGSYSVVWNGTDANNCNVASGVYFYRLSNPARTSSKRMLLMK
ncbi:MAG: T9SS type A sorting domain-containing protein [Candidatus Cloacimonetes bacterium]|nr:T9SS type A sorting domain-containing protein [Candidatus Cloacimonadota bacterium]